MVAINTIMADSLDYIATELETLVGGRHCEFNDAVQKVLARIITDHGAVIFNGNGYSDEWQEEAAARGLQNLRDHRRRAARSWPSRRTSTCSPSTRC